MRRINQLVEVFWGNTQLGRDLLITGERMTGHAFVSVSAAAREHMYNFVGQHTAQRAAEELVGLGVIAAEHRGADCCSDLLAGDLTERL